LEVCRRREDFGDEKYGGKLRNVSYFLKE